jgi:hypothetical protein
MAPQSHADSRESWRAALDARLLRRLMRPVERPGLARIDQAHAIIARMEGMVASRPLADTIEQRWRGTLDAQAELPPIVYAQPPAPIDDAGQPRAGGSENSPGAPAQLHTPPATRAAPSAPSPLRRAGPALPVALQPAQSVQMAPTGASEPLPLATPAAHSAEPRVRPAAVPPLPVVRPLPLPAPTAASPPTPASAAPPESSPTGAPRSVRPAASPAHHAPQAPSAGSLPAAPPQLIQRSPEPDPGIPPLPVVLPLGLPEHHAQRPLPVVQPRVADGRSADGPSAEMIVRPRQPARESSPGQGQPLALVVREQGAPGPAQGRQSQPLPLASAPAGVVQRAPARGAPPAAPARPSPSVGPQPAGRQVIQRRSTRAPTGVIQRDPEPGPPAEPAAGLDIEAIVDRVERTFLRRLEIEGERRGVR